MQAKGYLSFSPSVNWTNSNLTFGNNQIPVLWCGMFKRIRFFLSKIRIKAVRIVVKAVLSRALFFLLPIRDKLFLQLTVSLLNEKNTFQLAKRITIMDNRQRTANSNHNWNCAQKSTALRFTATVGIKLSILRSGKTCLVKYFNYLVNFVKLCQVVVTFRLGFCRIRMIFLDESNVLTSDQILAAVRVQLQSPEANGVKLCILFPRCIGRTSKASNGGNLRRPFCEVKIDQ